VIDATTNESMASLMELEELFRGIGNSGRLAWRAGNKIAKDVSDRKVLLYALFRRMDDAACSIASTSGWRGFASSSMEEQLQKASVDLEDIAKGISKIGKPSLIQLCAHIRKLPADVEPCPQVYEEQVLKWPAVKGFANGNPRATV